MYTSVSSFYTLSLHDALPISGRHDLERHPRGVHQHARLSDAAVGDVEVSRAGPAAGGGRAARDARAGEDHRTRAGARHARHRRARGRGDLRLQRRARGRVRGHSPEQEVRDEEAGAGADGQGRPALRTAVPHSVPLLIRLALAALERSLASYLLLTMDLLSAHPTRRVVCPKYRNTTRASVKFTSHV